MKNSRLVKMLIIGMVILVNVFCINQMVYAANDTTDLSSDSVSDLSELSKNNTSSSNNSSSNTSNTSNKLANNTSSNNTKSNNTANNVMKTNNTANYNNTTLPKTGIADSTPVAIIAVVLIISAVFAYRKIEEYKNL